MKKNETKTQKNNQSKAVRIAKIVINTVINIMIVMVLIVSLLIAMMALSSKKNDISSVFGYTIQPIQSDSMLGGSDEYDGGDFKKGDLMIAKATNFDEDATYEVGDIVTFISSTYKKETVLVSHRIVDVKELPDGSIGYQTWGDNREVAEVPDQLHVEDYLHAKDIASVYYSDSYKGKIIKGLGSVVDFLQTQKGFFFVVLLPMIIFFLYALIRVVLSASGFKKTKVEEDRDAAVKAAVAAALAEKEGASDNEENDADALPAEMTPEQMEQFKQFMEFQKLKKEKQEPAQSDIPEATASDETVEQEDKPVEE